MSLANVFLFSLGIAAMAVPLWVHLRLGKVKKRAVVPTLRLMQATPQTSKSPRKLVDVPLLLLRLLILLLLALGFGRLLMPVLASKDAVEHVVMVLDVSGSMQAKDGKVWEQARDEALAALNTLNASSEVAILQTPRGEAQPVWESPADAITRVREMKPGYGPNLLAPALLTADQLLRGMPDDHPKVLHVISDFQRSAFVDIARVSLSSDVVLRLAKVGEENLGNRGISVKVASAGLTDIGVYAFHDGSNGTLKGEENGKIQDLAIAYGQDAVRLSHTGNKAEWVSRRLFTEDKDALAADNQAWDVYHTQQVLPVLLWEPTHAERDFEKSSYFIARALQPVANNGAAPISRYRPVVIEAGDLASASEDIAKKDGPRLLMVPATSSPSAALAKLVKEVLGSGGSVVFFGGSGVEGAEYESVFGQIFGVQLGDPEDIKANPALLPITASNPLWGGLDPASRMQISQASLRKRHALVAKEGASVLASYADDVPFIVENMVGNGRVFFVNTAADRSWGDWATQHHLFIPTLHLLSARALDSVEKSISHPPVVSGQSVDLHFPASYAGKELKVAGQSYSLDADGVAKQVTFAEPGVVDLVLADGIDAGKIAVNFPTTESNLVCDPAALVRQRLESLRRQDENPTVRWENETRGGLAWKICLFGAALLLVIEPAIANHRKKIA